MKEILVIFLRLVSVVLLICGAIPVVLSLGSALCQVVLFTARAFNNGEYGNVILVGVGFFIASAAIWFISFIIED